MAIASNAISGTCHTRAPMTAIATAEPNTVPIKRLAPALVEPPAPGRETITALSTAQYISGRCRRLDTVPASTVETTMRKASGQSCRRLSSRLNPAHPSNRLLNIR